MVRQIWTGRPLVRIRSYSVHRKTLLCWLLTVCLANCYPAAATLTFHVQEEQPPGSYVGHVPGSNSFAGTPTQFTLNSQTGVITTTVKIDRETLQTNPIILTVRSTDSTRRLLSVQVQVDDINDNQPQFPSQYITLRISETRSVNGIFPINTATDLDAGDNGTVDYSIMSGDISGSFSLGRGLAVCQRSELCLVTKKKLDREITAFYQLNITATDRGTPSLVGHCLVNITIVDFNDNSPVFARNAYDGSIAENTKSSKSILTVSATDKDAGSNRDIRYSIEVDAEKSNEVFDMDEILGVIRTKGSLDYETKTSYTFRVIARDRGQPSKSAQVTVTIRVLDQNDNAPSIIINYLPFGSTKAIISEDAQILLRIALVQVSDDDFGVNSLVQLQITKGNELGHFSIQKLQAFYYLQVAKTLDREEAPYYNLTLNATDQGVPSQSTVAFALVSVTDINDNSPEFTRQVYTANLSELAQNGSFVYQLNASDPDSGNNGSISYSITGGNDLGWFKIDGSSGLVTTASAVDKERLAIVSLTITAQDHGSSPRTATTTLKVKILDENDNPPVFDQSVFRKTVPEDKTIGASILTLVARDADDGDNARIAYEIDPSAQDVTSVFMLEAQTGLLRTKMVLDHEVKHMYTIPVVAKDHGNPQLSSKATILITVSDINDNYPLFYPVTYFVSVIENEKPGELVQVTATDRDIGLNAAIHYIIIDGNNQGNFSINSTTGVINTLTALDHEVKEFYRLNITARDGGGNYASQPAVVEITVLNKADNPPVFQHEIYNFSVYENVPKGTQVGKVYATTKDKNGTVNYDIISGDPKHLFIVDPSGGIIMVDGKIDREENAEYWLNIIAKVGKLKPLSAKASVNIAVLDKNDNVPHFSSSSSLVEVHGTWLIGRKVYNASAVDRDAGNNGLVRYQLTANANGLFSINSTSGIVSLARRIAESDDSQYTVQVLASDYGSPPRHNTMALHVTVLINHPPKFTLSSYVTHVLASRPLSYQFFYVSAVDRDGGKNGRLTYSIASNGNNEGLFGIFPGGKLYIKKSLQQASKGSYNIRVRVVDGGTPPLGTSVSVTIYIQDSNGHRTLFINNTFRFSVLENSKPGTLVGTITAKATNPSKTKDIVYSLVSSPSNFAVDARSGQITTRVKLDRETLKKKTGSNSYIMQAEAVYNDTTVKRDKAIVIVTVTDVNDNAPVFSRSVYSITVSEKTVPGTAVFRVMAIDIDDGRNAKFIYSLTKGTGLSKFYINMTNGDLILNTDLDREVTDRYNATVQATDLMNSSLFSQAVMEITVGDSNDNRPVFRQSFYTVDVFENLLVQSVIIKMNATDKDIGQNGQIVYSITSGNLAGLFDINHATGKVTIAKQLDFEIAHQYNLTITAKDHGIVPLLSVVNLTVNVLDVNDNPPVFAQAPQILQVLENVKLGHVIGLCAASDRDSGNNGQITYSFHSQNPRGKTFSINPANCEISTAAPVDREKMPNGVGHYQLVVMATDQAIPISVQLSTKKQIIIQVIDVNDNSPRFISPPAAPAGSNSFSMTVKAQDLDTGRNGNVTYNIVSGNEENQFSIDKNNGRLTTQSPLTNNPLMYRLIIKAQDGGKSPRSNQTVVTVFKEGPVGSGPSFTNASYQGFVTENQAPLTSVLYVQAAYPQGNQNGNISYYLTADTSKGAFEVVQDTGEIVTRQRIDREGLGSSFDLVVYAVDKVGPSPRTSPVNVNIVIRDLNDNAPEFSSMKYSVSIAEGVPLGTRVAALTATDTDEGENARVTYTITGGNHGNKFRIEASSGNIFTEGQFDRETRHKYSVNVTAQDHGIPFQASICVVMVTITDINDNQPTFTKAHYVFSIAENAQVGTAIGSVSAEDKDSGENARLTYRVVGSDHGVFTVDSSSGELSVGEKLDREIVEHYVLNVTATDNGRLATFTTSVNVYINVRDKNDNAPQFTKSIYSGQISEASGRLTHILSVTALDRDSGTNALVKYSIISGNTGTAFAVLENGTVVNIKVLDREERDYYILEVRALDQSVPVSSRLEGLARVVINVTDINDNNPYFTSASVAHVPENANTGDVVLTVIAVDLDQGLNSEVRYSLTKLDLGAPFSLGRTDGVLRVTGVLDRETKQNYSVRVTASDRGEPFKSSSMTIVVVIDDYNDHSPEFRSHPSEVRIDENATPGTDIIRLTAVDGDSGTNADIRYLIIAGNDNGTFAINPVTGRLRTVKYLDRELSPRHVLEIRAYDLGVPRRANVTSVTVILRDINDNRPKFTKAIYVAGVSENVIDSSIVTVIAEDRDDQSNGDVTYQIVSGDNRLFIINQRTGTIGLSATLDREQKTKYFLRVKAQDGGTPALSGEAVVILNVLDKNDNTPTFSPTKLTAKVRERSPVGTQVILVTATDADVGANAVLTYSLKNSFGRFKIDPRTGAITTLIELDRELIGQHPLEVMATDGGSPALQGTLNLDVVVEDVNDHDPEFQQSLFRATVPKSASPGTIVFIASARDRDTGVNAESDYSITSGASVFGIEVRTGIITVTKQVPQNPSSYSLQIKATNRNAPQRTATATVQISVSSASFPRFQHQDQQITVRELVRTGTKLLTVNATGHTAYYIAAGNTGDVFDIDTVLGTLTTKKALDYETDHNFTLIIGANDGSNPPHVGYISVYITVTDANDNAPVFSQSIYTALVKEELPADATVITVLAVDADSGSNAELEYSIPTQGIASLAFNISRTSGRIFTTRRLDRENISSYILRVSAENTANRSSASEATVIVKVTDINDNPPTLRGPLKALVWEKAAVGTLITVLRGIDRDETFDSPLHYGFLPNGSPDETFVVDASSGNVSLAKALDREHKASYHLQVFVNDSKHVASAILVVDVLDINDNPPRFLAKPYITQLLESSRVGIPVMNVTAIDADEGTNAEITYSLLPSPYGNLFYIDSKTGIITLNKALVFYKSSARPSPNIYNITVRARNVYSPYFKSDAYVQIEVLDSNDHSPVFKKSSYNFFAMKDTSSGVSIGKVEAVDDLDYGPNAEVRYEALSGNGTSKFRVVPETGDVRVSRSLISDANKTFYLHIRAKDMGRPSRKVFTKVFIEVTELNLYSPAFTTNLYQASVTEDQTVGSVIISVTASDQDFGRNGEVTYAIVSGNEQGYFGAGRRNGSIFAAKYLDYEFRDSYVLNVTATDGGKLPKTSSATVELTLKDINDNNPVFDTWDYHCQLPENTTPKSIVVCTVHATDRDERGQQKVRYYIAGGIGQGQFIINAQTGQIQATAEFDFETTTKSFLSVGAKDVGLPPQRFADPRAKVHIMITGKNEFKPVFTQKIFTATVAENAPIGHSFLKVSASDRDNGPDGVVLYHLIGADNHKGFTINANSGVLSVSGKLDNEKASTVTLRLIAKNLLQTFVTPSTIDQATIIVTVTDANDPPRFLKSVYTAVVTEGSRTGTYVTNVTAVDDDKNGVTVSSIRYGLGGGNTGIAFVIDTQTGIIRTVGELDRETIPVYHLTVTATDNGAPPMMGNGTVVVTLGDINDNPPRLANCVGRVLENQPIGTSVITLRAEDPDVDPNRGPYSYVISGTNYGKFQLNPTSGLLKTTAKLDRENLDRYNISIRVADSGGESTISYCLIRIGDQNDNRPRATSREVYVNTYQKRFPGGPVADVRPDDPDVDDNMTCRLLRNPRNLFSFPRGDCMLQSLVYTGDDRFDLFVNGSDGLGAVQYSVTLKFFGYDKTTVQQSVAVRLQNATTKTFLGHSYSSFVTAVNGVLQSGYISQLFSVQQAGKGLVDILIAVRQNNMFTYMEKEKVSELLKSNRNNLQMNGNVKIKTINYTPCSTNNPCQNRGECSSNMQATGQTSVVRSVPVVMLSANYNWHYECRCKPGFTGERCETKVSVCNPNPCRNGGSCRDDVTTLTCACAPGYTGRVCEVDINECTTNPCRHSTSCQNTPGSYTCSCKPGYTGKNCDTDIDYCQASPCMYNSTCVDQSTSYKCTCDFGGRGDQCQFTSLGFEPVSYMKFPTIASKNQLTYNNITLDFATSSENGLLMYNNDGGTSEDGDFISLEIIKGKVRFSYNLGYTASRAVIQSDRFVDDGRWHRVTVIRDKMRGQLEVDSCCLVNGTVTGAFIKLELHQAPLYVGGIKDFDQVLNDRRQHIQVYDFVGCIRDFYVNGDRLEAAQAQETPGSLNRCPRKAWCASSLCQRGGKCVDTWFDYYCECPDGYSGRNCEKAIEAFRFSSSSFLVLQFKKSYLRDEKLKEHEASTSRQRREVGSVPAYESFSVLFRTRQDGLILLAEDNNTDYTILQITSGKVSYSFKASNAGQILSITSPNATDGNWHNVTLGRRDKTVTLSMENKITQRNFAVTPHKFLGSNVRTWSLGGFVTPPSGLKLQKFRGCMEKLKINGINVPMNGPNKFMVAKPHGGAISEGCDTSGACKANPCVDNVEKPACYEEWDGYTCISDVPCRGNPCQNNGTCKPQKNDTFLCICQGNFTGKQCHIPKACLRTPCTGTEICQGDGSGGIVCVPERPQDDSYSVGIIAGVVFLVVVFIGIMVGILAVRRHQRFKRQSDYDAKHCDEIGVPADLQDASHRTSPSHSSDDSGVVIRNPSQKSMPDLHTTSVAEDNKNIVIHNVGAPEDYQIKLTKSDEKIDHGFSESDVGEFVIRNDLALKYGSADRLNQERLARKLKHSTREPYRGGPRQRPRTRDRKIPGSLARQVLDRRQFGPRIRPSFHGHRKRRTNSMDTTSSDEPLDFSDAWPDIDNNSERLDYYDIDVASIGVSEASYQYDPSSFKDSVTRRDLPGFSQAEIERIRQQSRNPRSGSFLDAISTSSDDAPTVDDKLSSLLEHVDTSSESSDDTFTCSEFEFDNERPVSRAEEIDPHGSMVFSKLTTTESLDNGIDSDSPRQGSRMGSRSTLNVSDEELIIANRFAQRPVNGTSEPFNWDDVLNWGLRYHNLRGVYKDIAQLKDSSADNDEEYV